MIQYYQDLKKKLNILNEFDLQNGQIQKIYSTAYFISLAIRAPGKTCHLYLGRGGGFEGIWVDKSPPPSILRQRDSFLEYLRSHLSATGFYQLSLDKNDRILKFDYYKFSKLQSFLFFWKGRSLYFIHYYFDGPDSVAKIFMSWRNRVVTASEDQDLFSVFDEVGRDKNLLHDKSQTQLKDMPELLQTELHQTQLIQSPLKSDFLERKKSKILKDLESAKEWLDLQEYLKTSPDLEELSEIKIGFHHLKFSNALNSFERRGLIFEKIKKLKRGEEILLKRLAEVDEMLLSKTKVSKVIKKLTLIRPVWRSVTVEKKTDSLHQDRGEYRIYTTMTAQYGIGLTAIGNDQLRSTWANKEDYWIHLDNGKSPHVIIKMNNHQIPPGVDEFTYAASILAHFSHHKDNWVNIVMTQVKYLKGIPGSSGMVTFKKEKRLRCQVTEIESLLKE